MGIPSGTVCIRCTASHPSDLWFEGCTNCDTDHSRSNLTLTYDYDKISGKAISDPDPRMGNSIWRYHPLFPVEAERAVTLGEGGTPLLPARRVGTALSCEDLWLKDESRNPTGSFKDRLCAVAVAKARASGARTVAVSSTGNQGASLAAYAAAAGLSCVVLTLASIPEPLRVAIQVTGAHIVALPKPADRWVILGEGVERESWFPISNYVSPPIGSNFHGIEGYKTIAYEIWEQRGRQVPGAVIVPTCYGDGLYGIWKGFRELQTLGLTDRCPQMVAAEVSGWLSRSLEQGSPWEGESEVGQSAAFNLITSRSTYQGCAALLESGGIAVQVGEEEILAMQHTLAREEGLYGEASSVIALAALERLAKEGRASWANGVVAILTSAGIKDPATTARGLPPLQMFEPTLNAVLEAIGGRVAARRA